MLYLTDVTPAAAQAWRHFWMSSMSRSRSGLLPSMIAGRRVPVDEGRAEQRQGGHLHPQALGLDELAGLLHLGHGPVAAALVQRRAGGEPTTRSTPCRLKNWRAAVVRAPRWVPRTIRGDLLGFLELDGAAWAAAPVANDSAPAPATVAPVRINERRFNSGMPMNDSLWADGRATDDATRRPCLCCSWKSCEASPSRCRA